MAGELNGRRVAILAADGVERVELEQPRQALEDAGASTVVVSIASGEIQARDHDLEDAGTFAVDQLVGAASVDDYEALLLPGKPVASICHGPWNFVEADVARDLRLPYLRGAQQHGHRYIPEILDRMSRDEVQTEHLATHVMSLDDGAKGDRMFKDKEDGCVRAVFRPGA